MKKGERELDRLYHMQEAIASIEKFLENIIADEFVKSDLIQSAVLQKFMIIGEAVSALPDDFKKEHFNINWKIAKDFRNFIIHEYMRIDRGLVWSTAKNDIPGLKEQIVDLINYLEKEIEK